MVTIFGLIGNIVAAYLLAIGEITWGGIVVLAFAPIDALDGTMARLRGETTRFGGFVELGDRSIFRNIRFWGFINLFFNAIKCCCNDPVFFCCNGFFDGFVYTSTR